MLLLLATKKVIFCHATEYKCKMETLQMEIVQVITSCKAFKLQSLIFVLKSNTRKESSILNDKHYLWEVYPWASPLRILTR